MAHHSVWKKCAAIIEEKYGDFTDWYEGYFICPHCGEPIYDCDWENSEYYPEDREEDEDYLAQCPICCETIEEE